MRCRAWRGYTVAEGDITDFKKRGRGGPEKREDLGWTGESTAFQAREICS